MSCKGGKWLCKQRGLLQHELPTHPSARQLPPQPSHQNALFGFHRVMQSFELEGLIVKKPSSLHPVSISPVLVWNHSPCPIPADPAEESVLSYSPSLDTVAWQHIGVDQFNFHLSPSLLFLVLHFQSFWLPFDHKSAFLFLMLSRCIYVKRLLPAVERPV